MIGAADTILDYLIVDKGPVERWTFGRVMLAGDAPKLLARGPVGRRRHGRPAFSRPNRSGFVAGGLLVN